MKKLNFSNLSELKQQKRQKQLSNIHNRFLSSRQLKQFNDLQVKNDTIQKAIINFEKSLEKEFQQPASKQYELKLMKNINCEQEKVDYENYLNKNFHNKVWNNFLFKRSKIRNSKLKELSKVHVLSQEQKQQKVIKEIEQLCQIMFQEITSKIYLKENTIYQINEKVRQKYKISHQLYRNYLALKQKLGQLQKQTLTFFKTQKENQKQRNQSLMDKRNQKVSKKQYEYLNLNLNDEGVKQVIQKKAKLNLELDLSFQIQQRKLLNQKKRQFESRKNSLATLLSQQKANIDRTKLQINELQKQQSLYQQQKQVFQQERKNLLKNLLKFPQYRSDGIVWTLKKMLQIEYKPTLHDLCEELDKQAKQYIIKQYNKLKKQFKPTKRTFKSPLKQKNRLKNPTNRTRVKSMVINTQSPLQDPQNFFKFQFKNNFAIEKQFMTKKHTFHGLYDSQAQVNLGDYYEYTANNLQLNLQKQKINSFKDITTKKCVKQVYEGAKSYINKWVKQQGWKSASARKFQPSQNNVFNQDYINKQKIRLKQKYHKIGGSNIKYQIMVKTLFGDKQFNNQRRIKTSRS